MITKTGTNEEFNLSEVNRIEAKTSNHIMAKYRKNKPYKLSTSKAILWFSILTIAIGFLFLWYKVIIKLIDFFTQ